MISKFIRVINVFSYGHNDPILKILQRYNFFLKYANKWTIFLKFYEKGGISLQKGRFLKTYVKRSFEQSEIRIIIEFLASYPQSYNIEKTNNKIRHSFLRLTFTYILF